MRPLVLIVTPHPALRAALPEHVSARLGCECATAASSREARETLLQRAVTLVLTESAQDENASEFLALTVEKRVPAWRLIRPVHVQSLLRDIEQHIDKKTEIRYPCAHDWFFYPLAKLLRNARGEELPLTEKESALLETLISAGKPGISKDLLLRSVWGYEEDLETRALETALWRLRGKLRQCFAGWDPVVSEGGLYGWQPLQ